jgi:hypothetical protein
MPIHSEIDPIGRLVRTRIERPLTPADIRRHLSEVSGGRVHDCPELIDARQAGHVMLSPRDMLELAHQARRIVGDRPLPRRAFVVADEDGFLLARTFAALVAGWVRIGVFDDPHSAESWLNAGEAGQGTRSETSGSQVNLPASPTVESSNHQLIPDP